MELLRLNACASTSASAFASRPRSALLRCSAASHDQTHANSLWVFQARPPRGSHYSLLDVRDAVEACSHVRGGDEREQCFLNFGLDARSVDTYYEPVMRMEEAVQERTTENDAVAQRMVGVAGFFLLLLISIK